MKLMPDFNEPCACFYWTLCLFLLNLVPVFTEPCACFYWTSCLFSLNLVLGFGGINDLQERTIPRETAEAAGFNLSTPLRDVHASWSFLWAFAEQYSDKMRWFLWAGLTQCPGVFSAGAGNAPRGKRRQARGPAEHDDRRIATKCTGWKPPLRERH